MSDVVIRVENLSKRYRIGERECYFALRDVLTRALQAPARMFLPRTPASRNGHDSHIWALKDASFEIRQGEVVGIIGRNGAGKSTLLKILARVTKPTCGLAEIRGRIGSLLEVGTGFHPELTGRENTYLNGAILGMSKKEVGRKFDEIVAFAEIEKFIDTPVKHYSSGMYLRLAFSVAAHLDTEVLLVDEVLAVGDSSFQKKCLGKVSSVADQGRTVLFVSHSMAAVSTLCKNAILLDHGGVKALGPVSDVMSRYLSHEAETSESIDLTGYQNREGTGEVRISQVSLWDRTGRPCRHFEYRDDLVFDITLESHCPYSPVHCVIEIHTLLGVPVLHLFSLDDQTWSPLVIQSKKKIRCVLTDCDLYPGTYLVSLWLGPTPFHSTEFVHDVLQFHMGQGDLHRRGFDMTWRHGLVHRDSSWSVVTDANQPTIVLAPQSSVELD